jgi:hypothetical protein
MFGVTDALPSGAAQLDNNDGLFSVRFRVAPGMVGSVPILFNSVFTNLADANGDPVPVELEPGVITVTQPLNVITGTSGNDQYHVLRSGSQLLIYENTPAVGQPTYTREIAALDGVLTINAGEGNDALTVDPGAEAALGLHRLIYNAGAGNNTLVLVSGSARVDSFTAGGTLNTTIKTGAHLSTMQLQQNALTLEDNSRVTLLSEGDASVITSLALGSGATLDVGPGALVLDYTGPSPVAEIRQHIVSGRGGTGLGAPWTGAGITSSAAATNNATDPEGWSVGYAENAALPLGAYTSFRGQAIDDTAILIAYVRTSDANLDGAVNDDDVTIVGATYAPGASNGSWALGDFDFNGFVNDDDVTLLGAFYEPQTALAAPAFVVGGTSDHAGAATTGFHAARGERSWIDSELINLLAESINVDRQWQVAGAIDAQSEVRRRSQAADVVWAEKAA